MKSPDRRRDAEFAGALTPELEVAFHSTAHAERLRASRKQQDGGDAPSPKDNLPETPRKR